MTDDRRKIRVVIADDSFFMRRILKEILDSDPALEVIGEARDGIEAIAEAARLKPDVITMDYRMPKLNGARATERILLLPDPTPIIIMISAYTKEGAEETFKCLRAGAVDFVLKPSGEISLDIEKVKDELLVKVKGAAHARVAQYKSVKIPEPKKAKKVGVSAQRIVVIGASTGGPPVVEDILAGLPEDLAATVFVVQHMPKFFTETSARRFNTLSPLMVKEAEDGEVLRDGTCYIAPGDSHSTFAKTAGKNVPPQDTILVRLTKQESAFGTKPSIDVSMTSAAAIFGERCVAILLTGMGDDGVLGMRAVKHAGGHTIVQDPQTAVVDSMPKAVIGQGLADEILLPQNIAPRIIELCA